MRRICFTVIIALFAGQAFAQDAAVLIGTERYRNFDHVENGSAVVQSKSAMEDAGYAVSVLRDDSIGKIHDALGMFLTKGQTADRLVVAMSGRFVTDGLRTWYLPAKAKKPTLFSIGTEGVSVDSVMDALAQTPEQALLLLGSSPLDLGDDYDQVLRSGVGKLNVPDGVTVMSLRPNDLRDVIEKIVTRPGGDVMDVANRNRRVTVMGFAPDKLILQNEPTASSAAARALELLQWETAREIDTVDEYQSYIVRYPYGKFVPQARVLIEEIRTEPYRSERLAEEEMELSRDERRQVQSNLSVLGYDTRGIDGIWGKGSRRAIVNWQQKNGFRQTSYVNDEQLLRIDAQAMRRTAQIEAEAERQQEIEARRDRIFWEETGDTGGEAGLRAYLDRFPDGIFADQAKLALKQLENSKLRQAADVDRDAWNAARLQNSETAYLDYLREQPTGAFRKEAAERIEAIRKSNDRGSDDKVAIAAENALGLTNLARRLIEARLTVLGHDPGLVDGSFDSEARRAIRRFQQSRGMPATGYLDQIAVVQLLVKN